MADQESPLVVGENADVTRRLIVVDGDAPVARLLARAEADDVRDAAGAPELWRGDAGADEEEPRPREFLLEFFAYETFGVAVDRLPPRANKNGRALPGWQDADFS